MVNVIVIDESFIGGMRGRTLSLNASLILMYHRISFLSGPLPSLTPEGVFMDDIKWLLEED